MKAWWFSNGKTLPHGDNRRVKIGRTHKVKGEIIPCENGLHASVRPGDALSYAPGNIIWRVDIGGDVAEGLDKLCGSERTYLAGGVDASEVLQKFARLCALDVIHLWDAPEIVVRYLKTGNESIRGAAYNAAYNAAYSAASNAASRAASRAASSAAHSAAHGAASMAASRAASRAVAGKQNRRLGRMLTKLIKENSK